jgi:hypothetical protein
MQSFSDKGVDRNILSNLFTTTSLQDSLGLSSSDNWEQYFHFHLYLYSSKVRTSGIPRKYLWKDHFDFESQLYCIVLYIGRASGNSWQGAKILPQTGEPVSLKSLKTYPLVFFISQALHYTRKLDRGRGNGI